MLAYVPVQMDLEAVIERVCRCTWRLLLTEFGDDFEGRNLASLEMHLEAEIKLNSEMHLDAVFKRLRRRTGRPWSRNSELHLEAVIKCVWRCTWMSRSRWALRCRWRAWSSKFGHRLGGHDRARLVKYLEAVNRRCAGCWDSIHQLVNMQPWECDEVSLSLSSDGGQAGGG